MDRRINLDTTEAELSQLIERAVASAFDRSLSQTTPAPFISSRECAELIGVTSEHLCAMRARGDGPPWSGRGKWISLPASPSARLARNVASHGNFSLTAPNAHTQESNHVISSHAKRESLRLIPRSHLRPAYAEKVECREYQPWAHAQNGQSPHEPQLDEKP